MAATALYASSTVSTWGQMIPYTPTSSTCLATQYALQPLLQRPDVIGTVLHLEQRAVVGGAGAGRTIGRRRADKGDAALLQGLDDTVQTRQLCHGQLLSCVPALDDFQRERYARL